MTTPDRTAAMVAAARRRHDDTLGKATNALRHLDAAGQPITFTAVAAAARVSRAWLYRNTVIRAEIERLRRPHSRTTHSKRPAREQATTDSIRQQLQALHDLATELRAENNRLRDAVARKLGQQRTATTDEQH